MEIKYNIIFAVERRKIEGQIKNENSPIRMRITFNSNRLELYTGYRIDAEKWDEKKMRVKNSCSNKLSQTAKEINNSLNKYLTIINDIFKEYEVKNKIPSTEQLKEEFKIKNDNGKSPQINHIFFSVFDEFTLQSGKLNNWTPSTFQKFATLKKHIESYSPSISFNDITEDWLNDFLEFLRVKKIMRNSTILKQLSFLKWFLKWSVQKQHNTNRIFEAFKPKLKSSQKKVIFLTWTELQKLQNFNIPESKQYLERVRDLFLFCCYSSLRYSDMYNLRRSNVKDNHIEITTIKTRDSLQIELNKYSKAILDKYKNIAFKDDKVLPVISNQKMNDYLKELAELVGINEEIHETYYIGNQRIDQVTPKYALLGTHAGRRTFICNALSLGIPVNVVMKWTGHADYSAMKPYIDIADEIKADAMTKFNNF